jgi:Cdc6-like AAA superfamily ATPase
MTSLIDSVDFGHNDAKRDHNLPQYFLDRGWISSLVSGKKFFIFGRKGSGKTALARQLKDSVTAAYAGFAALLSFKSFAAQQLLKFKDRNFLPPNEYQTFWRYLLLLELTKQLLSNNALSHVEELVILSEFMRKNFHRIDASHANIVKETSDLGFKVGLPEKFSGAGIEFKAARTKEGEFSRVAYNRIVDELERLVFSVAKQGKYFVILDELDDIYDGSVDYRSLIVSLLKVAADLNSHEPQEAVMRIIVCLRTDIVNQLRDSDLNKYADDRIDLNWLITGPLENSELRHLINLRIAASTNINIADDPWSRVFSSRIVPKTRQDPFRFMIDRTLHRPRDIIQFCKECQKVAAGKKTIEADDVWAAEKKYSEWFKREIIDEIHVELPEIVAIYDALRRLQKATFKMDEFVQEFCKKKELESCAPDETLRILFRFSVVGHSSYPRGGGPRKLYFAFRSGSDDISLDITKDIVVNRGLWRGLSLY